nr:uncharacterized protein LOC117980782 [Pan paniscus]
MGQWEEGNKRSKVEREKLRADTPEGNLQYLQHHTVAAAECRGMGSKTEMARFHHPLMPGKGGQGAGYKHTSLLLSKGLPDAERHTGDSVGLRDAALVMYQKWSPQSIRNGEEQSGTKYTDPEFTAHHSQSPELPPFRIIKTRAGRSSPQQKVKTHSNPPLSKTNSTRQKTFQRKSASLITTLISWYLMLTGCYTVSTLGTFLHPTPRSHSKTPLNRLPSPLQPPTESGAPAASAAPEPSRSLTCCFGVSKSLLLLSSPPGASEPPLSLFFLFFRTAQAPGAKNNRGSGERRVPAARISGPKRGWRRRGRPMQRIARRRRQPGCCGRQLKNGSRKLLLTMNEGIRFTRQGPPAKLGFPAGFSNHICISPPLNPPRTVPTAHWASTSLLQSQSWSRAATYWFPLAAVHHGYRGDRAPICIGFLDWLAEEQFLGGGAKTFLLSHGRPRLA